MERLSKVLAKAGVASRRGAEELIFSKKVLVNGQLIEKPEFRVDPSKDSIKVNGKLLPKAEEKVYYMLNKPCGYVCSCKQPSNQRLIFDLIPSSKQRLFPVGRLDKNTSGLLLITNDGDFSNNILHPSKEVPKEYIVRVKDPISPDQIAFLKKPIHIEGRMVKADLVVRLKGSIKIVVHDGRKHEIRLMVQKAGLELISLKRIRIGNLVLSKVPKGSYRVLTSKEILLAQNN